MTNTPHPPNAISLKPCPFCGGAVHFSDDPDAHIVCMNPGCKLLDITFQASFKDFAKLAAQWNTRHTASPDRGLIEKLEEYKRTCERGIYVGSFNDALAIVRQHQADMYTKSSVCIDDEGKCIQTDQAEQRNMGGVEAGRGESLTGSSPIGSKDDNLAPPAPSEIRDDLEELDRFLEAMRDGAFSVTESVMMKASEHLEELRAYLSTRGAENRSTAQDTGAAHTETHQPVSGAAGIPATGAGIPSPAETSREINSMNNDNGAVSPASRQGAHQPVAGDVAEAREILARGDFLGVEESERAINEILAMPDQPVSVEFLEPNTLEYETAISAIKQSADQPVEASEDDEDFDGHLFVSWIANMTGNGKWHDEFLAWYKPQQWLSSRRAASAFITEKINTLQASRPMRESGYPAGALLKSIDPDFPGWLVAVPLEQMKDIKVRLKKLIGLGQTHYKDFDSQSKEVSKLKRAVFAEAEMACMTAGNWTQQKPPTTEIEDGETNG